MLKVQVYEISKIRVPSKRMRTLDSDRVNEIAESMLEVGQTTPIQIRSDGDRYVLIEGLHRLEAKRELGEETIEGYLVRTRPH